MYKPCISLQNIEKNKNIKIIRQEITYCITYTHILEIYFPTTSTSLCCPVKKTNELAKTSNILVKSGIL